MNFRLATNNDLDYLKDMYKSVTEEMWENDIKIWNEHYPIGVLAEDIENNRLYLLENDGEIIAAGALCDSDEREGQIAWNPSTTKATYMSRLGVNTKYLRQGFGTQMVKHFMELSKEMDADYMRLFVVDINIPATNLYLKNGFTKLDDPCKEVINEELTLSEYAFEINL